MEEEDAKRPHRERESLVAERTRIINRMKSCLARLGIRAFKPTLQRAPDLLPTLRTPEGTPLPANTLAEMGCDLARLRFVEDQIKDIEAARLERLKQAPEEKSHAMVRLLARVIGVGIETADMLVREVLSRNLRDRRAVARYAGLTGAPDESGSKRREKGLARAGNARVRRGMIQLAWRFLMFQKGSALAQWYRARTVDARQGTRKSLIVAMARKLLIELWRFVTTGQTRPASRCVRFRPARHNDFGAWRLDCRWRPMTIRGGGDPNPRMASMPPCRMGLPLRSSAADAHYCIMVQILCIYRIQVCGAKLRANWRAPLRSSSLSSLSPTCGKGAQCQD